MYALRYQIKQSVRTIEECDALMRKAHSTVISCNMRLGMDYLLEKVWEYLALVRIFTKPRGQLPDFGDPVVLTKGRHGLSVEGLCVQVHR
jgi:ribosome-interacting GTPase 1